MMGLILCGTVHGTWVCGRKLEAGVSVELKEGDTFMVGISTRVYRLSWVPLTQFNVFVPQQHENDYPQQEIIKVLFFLLLFGKTIHLWLSSHCFKF